MSTGFQGCTSQAAATLSSGDNDGFEVNGAGACDQGGSEAVDNKSGTADDTTCGDVNADRHVFDDFGLTIPLGASVNGIEVRLDAYVANSNNSPAMCVELSWNNGVSWTAAKTTPLLTNSLATYVLGSTTDDWGRSWIASQLGNGTLRVRVTNTAAKTDRDFHLDWVAVQVTYTP